MTEPDIHGTVAPGFDGVADALARSFRDRGEVGASLAVVVDGVAKVDVWAGHLDRDRSRPWQRDSPVNVNSTTKGVVAIAAATLADRGLLDPDAPVVSYWPEFGQAGKEDIPVRWLLSHEAGLPVIDQPLPPGACHWETMVRALEGQRPIWEPGTAMGYHALTFGWLVASSSDVSPASRLVASSATRSPGRSASTSTSAHLRPRTSASPTCCQLPDPKQPSPRSR